MFRQIGPPELIIILLIIVLLFGAKKLPETARGLGRSLRIFKAETKGLAEDEAAAAQQGTANAQPVPPRELTAQAPAAPVTPPAEPVAPPAVQPPVADER